MSQAVLPLALSASFSSSTKEIWHLRPLKLEAKTTATALPQACLWYTNSRKTAVHISEKCRQAKFTVRSSEAQVSQEDEEEDQREQRELEKLKAGMGQRRAVDRSERLLENPYAPVESAMTSPAVTTSPETLVAKLLESLEHFTGLPVVDESGKCVGIISSVDIFEHQRRASPSIMNVRVKDVMTSPAVVIAQHAPIAYCAGLMLKHKVHRIPVVDGDNMVVGIVTRTDIYEPLIPAVNPMYHRLLGVEDSM